MAVLPPSRLSRFVVTPLEEDAVMASLMLAPTALAESTSVAAPATQPGGSRCEVVSLAQRRTATRSSSVLQWHFYRRRAAA